MAEGVGKFAYKEGDTLLGHTDDEDDDAEQEAERTQPFRPGAASTPYHGGETIEMQTWQHELTGLPETSYGGTSRKITDEEIQRRLEALRDPNTGILPDSAIPLVPPPPLPQFTKRRNQKSQKFNQSSVPQSQS